MAVTIGSARSSYGNTKRGDQAGGREVSTQSWYLHSKGWRVFRAKDPDKRKKLSAAMAAACANDKIGYSQPDRLALFDQVRTKNYDPSKATQATNCDCSSLVRVCCWYAGIQVANFLTSDEPSKLMATGEFVELTDSKYTTKSDYLESGDVAVTRVKGHTIIIITDGPKVEKKLISSPAVYAIGDRQLKNGDVGNDVKDLQTMLINEGFSCGYWGVDGEFGDATEIALRNFQTSKGLPSTGVLDPTTLKVLIGDETQESGSTVKISGGNCYIREAPNTGSAKLGIAYNNTTHEYAGERSESGWYKIMVSNRFGWVSGKYGKLV